MRRTLLGLVAGLALALLAGADTSPPAGRFHGLAANNAAAVGNPLVGGAVAVAKGSAPATVSAGNAGYATSDTERRLLVNTVHPNLISGNGSAITATTQILGASGASLSYYVTDVVWNDGATGLSLTVVSSTTAGNACATSPATVVPTVTLGINGTLSMSFQTPIKVAANSVLCCKTSGSTSFSCLINGFIGP